MQPENTSQTQPINSTDKSKKRYSIDRPVAEDLRQHQSPSLTKTPQKIFTTNKVPKSIVVVGIVLLATGGCALLLQAFLGILIASRTTMNEREAARRAILSSIRLSEKQKEAYEKEFQDALNTSNQSECLWRLNILVDNLIPTDYVAAVHINYYIYQLNQQPTAPEENIFRFQSMRERQPPNISGENLLREAEKETERRIKNTFIEQAAYAFAKPNGVRAIEIAKQLSDKRQYSNIETHLVYCMMRNPKNVEMALAFARGIIDEKERSWALSSVFTTLLKTNPKRAQTLHSEIKDPEANKLINLLLITNLSASQPEEAIKMASRIHLLSDAGQCIGERYDVARVLALSKRLSLPERDTFLSGAVGSYGYAMISRLPLSASDQGGGSKGQPASMPMPVVTQPSPRLLLAFQVIPFIQDKALRENLRLQFIRSLSPKLGRKALVQVLTVKEEPFASQIRREMVMMFVNPNLPRNCTDDFIIPVPLPGSFQE
jgi:hypothetical protein